MSTIKQEETFGINIRTGNTWYKSLLITYPEIIITSYIFLTLLITPINFWLHDLPTFSDPIKGFSTQNTYIARQSSTSRLLEKAIDKTNGLFTLVPVINQHEMSFWGDIIKRNVSLDNLLDTSNNNNKMINFKDQPTHINNNKKRLKRSKNSLNKENIHLYGKLVVKNYNIGSYHSMIYFCSLPYILKDVGVFNENCSNDCDNGIESLKDLYVNVYNFYNNNKNHNVDICHLREDKWVGMRENVLKCLKTNCMEKLIIKVKTYLLTENYDKDDISLVILKESKSYFLNRFNSKKLKELQERLNGSLMGFDLGVKERLFLDTLISDVPYGILGAILVFVVLIFSSKSIIYSINIILIILMSLNFSYFIYRVILQIEFFPFINLLAGILLLGIGSDDTFILRENFEKFKNHVNDLPLSNILTKSLQKSCISIKDNIIEQYDLRYKNNFKILHKQHDSLIIRILFGIDQIDYAPFLTPNYRNEKIILRGNRKRVVKDENLEWIKNYCANISRQNFIMPNDKLPSLPKELNSIFIDTFYDMYMKKNCTFDDDICCGGNGKRPYKDNVIQYCISKMYHDKRTYLANSLTNHFWYPIGRPIFYRYKNVGNISNVNIYAIHQCSFLTKLTFSFDFWTMKNNYNLIIDTIKQNLSTAPNDILKNPVIDLEQFRFYDMHSSLLTETLISTLLGLLCAFIILWMSIKDTRITILALIVIIDIVVTTLSVMPFLNWHLNVVESTIILLTVGLSFDFVLHYAISYSKVIKVTSIVSGTAILEKTSSSMGLITPRNHKHKSIITAINDVIYPIFVSATTTSVTGIAMTMASTLSFHQIGVFMITMAFVSFILSTFFFMSLLSIFGPYSKKEQSSMINHGKEQINSKGDKYNDGSMTAPLISKNFIKYSPIRERGASQPNLSRMYTRRPSSNYPIITEEYRDNLAGRGYLDRKFSTTVNDVASNLSLTKIAKSHQMIKYNNNNIGYVRRASLPISQVLFKENNNNMSGGILKMDHTVKRRENSKLDSMKEEP